MSAQRAVTFQEALDMVEALPDDQQLDLIGIVRRRRVDRRRDELVRRITAARDEYARGEYRRGSVEDLMSEMTE